MTTASISFRDQLAKFAENTNRSLAEAHRAISIKLFTAIIMDTPVDTGEAAGGWIPSMGAPVTGPSGVMGQAPAIAAVRTEIRALPSQVAYLSNSVDHVEGLEYGTHSYGYSPKAPYGMVRVNVARFQQLVTEAVEELRKGRGAA